MEDECAVSELSRWWYELDEWKCQEALLDLSVKWPGAWIPRQLIDITARDPDTTQKRNTDQKRLRHEQPKRKMRDTHQRMEHSR